MSFSGYKGRNPLNLTLMRRGKKSLLLLLGESELPANLRRCSCVLTTTNNLRHNFKLFPLLLNDATEDLYGPLRSDQEKAITTTHYIYIFFYCTSQTRWEVLRDGYSMDFPFIRNVGMKLMQGLIKKDP